MPVVGIREIFSRGVCEIMMARERVKVVVMSIDSVCCVTSLSRISPIMTPWEHKTSSYRVTVTLA